MAYPLVPRIAESALRELVAAFRVVVLNGPRQSGKTTLLEGFNRRAGGTFRTLDDEDTLTAAVEDPAAFVRQRPGPLIVDEIQRGGDRLLRAVKRATDTDRDRGRFILSGSARFLTVPTLSESLAGRAAFLDLWPLAVVERAGTEPDFPLRVAAGPQDLLAADSPWTREDYLRIIVEGGYPEPLYEATPGHRGRWFRDYLTTIATRDIREFATVRHSEAVLRLLALLAARLGTTLSRSGLARAMELGWETTRNYLGYLEVVFLTGEVQAWSAGAGSRVTKAPKVFLTDTGLAAHLLGQTAGSLAVPGNRALGPLVETLVFTELTKLLSFHDVPPLLWHYRDRDQREVDFLLELPDGYVVAIEVKASTSPSYDSAKHLAWLRKRIGDRFALGLVLHLGPRSHSFGDRILALPVSALWNHGLPADRPQVRSGSAG
ncbi:ATP-binding protein [Rhizohabitans arisaemae]|uniref:ATP-binding protein n=1 Tax=Rhizohabitans arisaemae TaxID=2720610 RepID=UPI0024B24A9C|nr:ATP-binding protein [Rhizohabitans arisaemae]